MNKMRATVSTLAILGSLGVIQNVSAIPVPGDCPDVSGSGERTSAVKAASEQDGDNWVYRYRVCNTTDSYYGGTDTRGDNVIVDWELPWFGDSRISDIVTPFGWTYSIEKVGEPDPFTGWGSEDTNDNGIFGFDENLNPLDPADAVPGWSLDGDYWKDFFDTEYDVANGGTNPFTNVENVLHFYVEQFQVAAAVEEERPVCGLIFEGDECVGFGFTSPFSAGDAPYQASWAMLPVRTGDPPFPLGANGGGIPNSPSVRLPGQIPEPGTAALIGLGLLSAAAQRRRRRKS